jgi:hypothetical protein
VHSIVQTCTEPSNPVSGGAGRRLDKFSGGATIEKHLFPTSVVPILRVIGHGTAKYSQYAAVVS